MASIWKNFRSVVQPAIWSWILAAGIAVVAGCDDAGKQTGPDDPSSAELAAPIDIGLSDYDPTIIAFTLEGLRFHVPVDRLYTFLEESEVVRGELVSGFTIVGLWPGFEPKTEANHLEFRELPSKTNAVYATVSRACPAVAAEAPPAPIPCTAKRAMEVAYGIYGRDPTFDRFVPAVSEPNASARAMPGMTLVGFIDDDLHGEPGRVEEYEAIISDGMWRMPNVFDQDVYMREAGPAGIEFTTCLRRTQGPQCRHRFTWRERFLVTVSFNVENIPHWLSVRDAVTGVLDKAVDAPDELTADRPVFVFP